MSVFELKPNTFFQPNPGPLLLVIMDGVGLYRGRSEGYEGNAFDLADTPNLDRLFNDAQVFLKLRAHGTAVGLPSDSDMGNSEVGHNAMGAGKVFTQGAKLVTTALANASLFRGEAWTSLVERVNRNQSAFHLLGLLSDGNVHSHIDHLFLILDRLAEEGIDRIRVHALADGRDVEPVSFDRYLSSLEGKLATLRLKGVDAKIASGGGRMNVTMDRYEANWEMVRRGWLTHVKGQGRAFASASEAVLALRQENPGIIDQDLPPFVIVDDEGAPLGRVVDGDAVVFFNFRGDRAIEISRAFTEEAFSVFDREGFPDIAYAGMMEYDGDLGIPPKYLVSPPAISKTVSEYLVHNGVKQFAVAETQKFGHVTYFWNGNNSEKFSEEYETWVEIQSDNVPFEQTPAMKAPEVCKAVLDAITGAQHRFIRVNFANGDMVGHTGDLEAAVKAMEVVDQCVGKLYDAIIEAGGTMIVTADHGNLDQMWDIDKKTGKVKLDANGKPVLKTSHTLAPVPWALLGSNLENVNANPEANNPGLGNIAATLLCLLGFEPPEDYLPSLITSEGR